jgi:hypothetical protein
MHRIVFSLFCIIFVVGAHGAAPKILAPIHKDAIELTQLAEKIWSLKPAIFKRTKPCVYCEVIDQCCEKKHRSEAISFFDQPIVTNNDFENLIEQCINTTTSNKEKQLCPGIIKSIVPWWIANENPDIKKYQYILMKYLNNITEFDNIRGNCNGEEIHAFMCSSNTKLVKSCAGKLLQEIYDNDYKNYRKTIKSLKNTLINADQELSKEFIQKTKTE